MEDLQLYLEEERVILKQVVDELGKLNSLVETQTKAYEKPHKNVEVSGKVEVNTEKEVILSNIKTLTDRLDENTSKTIEAIEKNSHKPLDSVKVTNIDEAAVKDVTVSNLTDIKLWIDALRKDLANNKPVVNVSKQEVVFPTSANKPIAVRLSDGKSFYNALMSVVSGANVAPVYDTLVAEVGNLTYVGEAQAGTVESERKWRIQRIDTSSGTEVRFADGQSSFTKSWTDRAGYTY